MPATERQPEDRAARVLVVDDEDSITQLVSTVLRYEGFEVECAADGRTAVRMAERFRPDLVVLDVMLPDWDGFEVYRRLDAESTRLPVLFLTARDAPADRVHGLTLGADDYVGKPFSLEELVARVRAVLRRRGLPLAAETSSKMSGRKRGSPPLRTRIGEQNCEICSIKFRALTLGRSVGEESSVAVARQ